MIENFNAKYVSLHVRKRWKLGQKEGGWGLLSWIRVLGLPWLLEKTPEVGFVGRGGWEDGQGLDVLSPVWPGL